MEGILRSKEMDKIDEIFKKAYDLNSNIVYFPIRHHSPACSYHLKKTIERYEPEIILIEGPYDSSNLIEYLGHIETKSPVCIYYSYSDSKGLISEEKGKYMCYYPLLDYSPELVGIRESFERKITCKFIDLPYYEKLINSRPREDDREYNDEYLIKHSTYIKNLCENEGCRSYDELWEKLFEIDGIYIETENFIRNLIASCYFSRIGYSDEMLQEDGCLAREIFMAEKIKEAALKYKKVLVITGGFHTSGLIELSSENKKVKLNTIPDEDKGSYAMAYSFEDSDLLLGYQSGMPYPAFYQRVWENIEKQISRPYEGAIINFIVKCGHNIRKKHGGISTADEIEALNMTKGLAALRSKREAGVYELLDGITSSFVKGELNISTDEPLKALNKLLRGRKTGKLPENAEVPPIVKDFRAYAEKFKFKTNTTMQQEIVLDIYKNKRHREISKFLHMMRFLRTDFCVREKGPDFINRKNINIIRETWKYKWSPHVESRLIELSVNGGSLKEACTYLAVKEISNNINESDKASLILIDCFMMGLEETLKDGYIKTKDAIRNDNSFTSLCDCLYNLTFLLNSRNVLFNHNEEVLKDIINYSYLRAVSLITGLSSASKDDEDKIISKLLEIYQLSFNSDDDLNRQILIDNVLTLINLQNCNTAIEGSGVGILYGIGEVDGEFVVKRGLGYLYGTGEKFLNSASFLKGLFAAGRDSVLKEDLLIKGIDNVIKNLSEEDFLKLLPDLRLSFSFFTPNEIDEIGEKVADLYNLKASQLLREEGVNPLELKFGMELDDFGHKTLRDWGIIHEE